MFIKLFVSFMFAPDIDISICYLRSFFDAYFNLALNVERWLNDEFKARILSVT